jgi:biotin operon repressor
MREAIAIVLSSHYPNLLSEDQLMSELNYSWKTADRRAVGRMTGTLKREGLTFFDKKAKGWQLSGAGYQWATGQVLPRFRKPEVPLEKRIGQIIAVTRNSVQVMDKKNYNTFETEFPDDAEVRSRLVPGAEIEYCEMRGGERRIVGTTGRSVPTW